MMSAQHSGMPRIEPDLTSAFHMDWLVPLDDVSADDHTRAVAEKAPALLRAARFLQAQRLGDEPDDIEVRLWVEAACGPACVSITWEPGPARFGFHLLDESLHERLACIVFHDLPCIDADTSLRQADDILDAAMSAVLDAPDSAGLDELAQRIRAARHARRIPVREGPRSGLGVDR